MFVLLGFVFVHNRYFRITDGDIFYNLALTILRNLNSLRKLQSIHIHCGNYPIDSNGDDIFALYLHNDNKEVLHHISEMCLSVSNDDAANSSRLYSIPSLMPKLEKLCLVFIVPDQDASHRYYNLDTIEQLIDAIILSQVSLKVLQIVAWIDAEDRNEQESKYCVNKMGVVAKFAKRLNNIFIDIRNPKSYRYSSKAKTQPLLFKFEMKSTHPDIEKGGGGQCDTRQYEVHSEMQDFADAIQSLTMNYLMTYPLGKMQFRMRWNVQNHRNLTQRLADCVRGMNEFCNVSVKECQSADLNDFLEHYFCQERDFGQYAMSVTNQNINDTTIEHEKKWKVDCEYCCNTAWV